MKLWQTAIAVTVAGGVAYVGYTLVKRASLEGNPINEGNALKPADRPVKPIENMEGVIPPALADKPSNWRAPRSYQSLSLDVPASRFAMRDAEPPSFSWLQRSTDLPLATVDVRTPAQRVAQLFRESNTPAEYDIFGNRTR
jgi:hypothetical protein